MFKNIAIKATETALYKTNRLIVNTMILADKRVPLKEEKSAPSNVAWGRGSYETLSAVNNGTLSIANAMLPEIKNTVFTLNK